jgi:hypothetical protein
VEVSSACATGHWSGDDGGRATAGRVPAYRWHPFFRATFRWKYAILRYLPLVSGWTYQVALGITHLSTSMLVLGFAALVIPAALDLALF